MSGPLVIPQKVDGFSYNTQLLYLPQRYFPNALAELDILRRANNYRPRWFVIPDDIGIPIAPFDTYYYQIEVAGRLSLLGLSVCFGFGNGSKQQPRGYNCFRSLHRSNRFLHWNPTLPGLCKRAWNALRLFLSGGSHSTFP